MKCLPTRPPDALVFFIAIPMSLFLVTADSWAGPPPQILRIEPIKTAPGQKIHVFGEHLAGTTNVLIAVRNKLMTAPVVAAPPVGTPAGAAPVVAAPGTPQPKTARSHLPSAVSKHAEFRIVSDTDLEVVVPETYCRTTFVEADIVLYSDGGVAVTCPASAAVIHDANGELNGEYLHVLDGGEIDESRVVTVIEEGGVVAQTSGAAWVLVRSGGTLGHAVSGTVFYEKGARLGASITRRPADGLDADVLAIPVTAMTLAEGIGPIVVQLPSKTAQTEVATGSPVITEVSPATVQPGDIVRLSGSGFAGATEVLVSGDHGQPPAPKPVVPNNRLTSRVPADTNAEEDQNFFPPHTAGFQVISDKELRFEMPLLTRCQFHVTVVTSRGATIAATKEMIISAADAPPKPRDIRQLAFPVVRVGEGAVIATGNEGWVYFIERGGTVIDGDKSGMLFLVQRSGTLIKCQFGQIYYEPSARTPRLGEPSRRHRAETINLSPVDQVLSVRP